MDRSPSAPKRGRESSKSEKSDKRKIRARKLTASLQAARDIYIDLDEVPEDSGSGYFGTSEDPSTEEDDDAVHMDTTEGQTGVEGVTTDEIETPVSITIGGTETPGDIPEHTTPHEESDILEGPATDLRADSDPEPVTDAGTSSGRVLEASSSRAPVAQAPDAASRRSH